MDRQDPVLLGLGQRLQPLAEQRLGEVEADPRRHHGQVLHRGATRRGEPPQPRQHGVGDGGRHRVRRHRERLGQVERVAGGQRVEGWGVPAGAGRQHGDRGQGQGRQREPAHRDADQRAEQLPQRRAGVQRVVSEAEHEDGRQPAQPAGEVTQHVEGGVVGPVHVLDDEHGRQAAELLDRCGEDVAARLRCERPLERPAGTPYGVPQRSERARGQQVVTRADEHPHPLAEGVEERTDHAGLPDAGFAGDQRDGSLPRGRVRDRLVECVEVAGALQQLPGHGSMVATSSARINTNRTSPLAARRRSVRGERHGAGQARSR